MTGVTIDIKANNKALEDVLEKGIQDTESFAAHATQEFATIGEASETLVEKLNSVVDNLGDLLKAQDELAPAQRALIENVKAEAVETSQLVDAVQKQAAVTSTAIGTTQLYSSALEETTLATKIATTSTAANTAATAKNTATLLAGLMTTAKFNLAMMALELSYEAVRFAAENTGHEISVVDKRLVHSQQIINECAGDLDKLQERLDEFGVTAAEVGIKIQTNWDKIAEASNDLLEQTFKGGIDKVAEETVGVFGKMWDSIGKYFDKAVSNDTKKVVTFLETTKKAVKEWQHSWVESILQVGGKNTAFIGEVMDFERKREQMAKDSKVAEINKMMTAKELAAFQDFLMAKRVARSEELHAEKLVAGQTVEALSTKMEAMVKERQMLVERNSITKEYAQRWETDYNTMTDAVNRLKDAQKALSKEIADGLGREAQEAEDDSKAIAQETAAYATMSQQQLLQLIEEEKALKQEIQQDETMAIGERRRAVEMANRRIAAMQAAEHAVALSNIEEKKQREADAIRFAERLRDQARDQYREKQDVDIEGAHNLRLQKLEMEGASLAALHKRRMEDIQVESELAVDRAKKDGKTQEQIDQIVHQYKLQAMREQHQFNARNAQDMAESGRVLAEYAKSKRDEEFEAKRKTEREVHEYRMKSLHEEANLALKMDNSEAEKLKINLQLQTAITAEKKRFADLQKETDVDVKQGGKEPQNMAQQMRELREYRAQQKKNLADAKAKKAQAAVDKKNAAKNKNVDRDSERAAAKQKNAEALSKKIKERDAKKAAYAEIQKRDKDIAIRAKFSKTAGLGAQAQMMATTMAGKAAGTIVGDSLEAARAAMRGDKQVSLQTQMAKTLINISTTMTDVNRNLKGLGLK